MESKEDSKESNVSFKRKTHCPLFRVCPIKSLFSGISCASAERDDSQGCTAHVKETPPSPKEKPEDLIGADIDSVRDDEDWFESLYSLMLEENMESDDSGVSFKSDWSKRGLIDFKDRVSLSGPDFSSSEEEHAVADDEDWIEFLADLSEQQQRVSVNMGTNWSQSKEDSKESGVSFKTDWSKVVIMYLKKKRSSRVRRKNPRSPSISSVSVERDNSQGHTANVKRKGPLSRWSVMNEESVWSNDSGVSFKSDRSKHCIINFNESSPPRGGALCDR